LQRKEGLKLFPGKKGPEMFVGKPQTPLQAGDATVVGRVRSSAQGWAARKV